MIISKRRDSNNLPEIHEGSLSALKRRAIEKKIVIAGGGTGGHIYPAIGIAQALKRLDAAVNIAFIGGADKLESTLVPQHGFRFLPISVAGFPRRLTLRWFPTLWKAFHGLIQSLRYMKELKPDVVIGTGGYVSGPVLLAGLLCKNSDCYPRTECLCWLNEQYIGTMGGGRLPCHGIRSREYLVSTHPTDRDNRKPDSSCNRGISEVRGNLQKVRIAPRAKNYFCHGGEAKVHMPSMKRLLLPYHT